MNEYTKGEVVVLEGKFRNLARQLVNPSAVKLEVKDPSNNIDEFNWPGDPEIINDSVGVFHSDVEGDEEGEWSYKYTTTGPKSADEKQFRVLPSNFP